MMMKTSLITIAVLAAAITTSTTASAVTQQLRSEPLERRMEVANYLATMAGTSMPQCLIENGFDYVGDDLKNVPGATAESCCDKCAVTTGCKAFTWTNDNGGTCWLKKGRGTITVSVNAKSALFIPGKRKSCQDNYNVDIVGNDIGNIQGVNGNECCDRCRATLGCRAYSWTADGSGSGKGTCYFKSGRGQSVVKNGVISADVYPATDFASSLFAAQEFGVEYPGKNLHAEPSATAAGCTSLCINYPTCTAYTWTNTNGGTCSLKNSIGAPVSKAGAVSSNVVPIPMTRIPFTYDTDIVGNDIGTYPAASASTCWTMCGNYVDGCRGLTWTDYNGGTCWFKNATGPTVVKQGAVSYLYSFDY